MSVDDDSVSDHTQSDSVAQMCVCVCVCVQRRGDPCAAKLFLAAETASKVRVKQNEIEFMRMLNHRNIVRFFAIEEEVQHLAVTYCDLFIRSVVIYHW